MSRLIVFGKFEVIWMFTVMCESNALTNNKGRIIIVTIVNIKITYYFGTE